MASAYLRTNKPARSQYRTPRRSRPTGLTVIHTAESVMDTLGPDTGAEAVARFIQRRDTYGSYHDLVDADSALQLVEYADEAYQDGTGSNPFAMSISFACRTTDWARMSPQRRAAFLAQGAKAFARQQAWLAAGGHPMTPLRRISRAQSAGGVAGFITHAERDPERRSDPGRDFPWDEWFQACSAAVGGTDTTQEDDMATVPQDEWEWAKGVLSRLDVELVRDGQSTKNRVRAMDGRSAVQTAALNRLLARDGIDVDEAELAATLAPLLAGNVSTLTDADLQAIATAVADENHRRQES